MGKLLVILKLNRHKIVIINFLQEDIYNKNVMVMECPWI